MVADTLVQLFFLSEVESEHGVQAVEEPLDIREVMRVRAVRGGILHQQREQAGQMENLLVGATEGP